MSHAKLFLPFKLILFLSALVLGFIAHADDEFKFALHGFTSASVYEQNTPQFVLNGQGPMILLGTGSTTATSGVDVRQTRLNFSVTGPQVFSGATPKAVAEIDFFGLNSPGGYGEVSIYPRLRLAYTELNWGDDVVRMGQDHELIFAQVPNSVGHMAFPVAYFAGLVGWREPSVAYFHTQHVGESKLEYAASVMKSDWQNPSDFGQATKNDLNVNAGQLSSTPGLEVRVKYMNDANMAYLAAHTNHVNASKVADLPVAGGIYATTPSRDFDVTLVKLGGKYVISTFTIAGDIYTGKNLAPMLGEGLQFFTANDVNETGGWLQVSYNYSPMWSIWGIYGESQLKKSEVESSVSVAAPLGRYNNAVTGVMIEAKDGNVAVGLEVTTVTTKTVTATDVTDEQFGIQYMLSGNYAF